MNGDPARVALPVLFDLLPRLPEDRDNEAFGELVGPYLRELQAHCYRILGSAEDAEDALQETLLSAWRGLSGFEEQASLKSWLYRVATNRCLDALRALRRRWRVGTATPDIGPPEPTRYGQVLWLQPYPDVLLEGVLDQAPGPEARYEAREAISLAFITALQLLPPRQRAVLVLRDVLGFRASEVADMLDATEESVKSALKRARGALRSHLAGRGTDESAPPPDSPAEREIVARLARAYEAGDLDGIVELLTDDVWLRMPPTPLEYHGRELAASFLENVSLRAGRTFRLVPTRANGQPAFGFYVHDANGEVGRATGLLVLTLSGRGGLSPHRPEPGLAHQQGECRTQRGQDGRPSRSRAVCRNPGSGHDAARVSNHDRHGESRRPPSVRFSTDDDGDSPEFLGRSRLGLAAGSGST